MGSKIVLYKVKDVNPYKQENGVITRKEYLQHWFANFVSRVLRDYLDSNGATKLKYGCYVVVEEKTVDGFKAVVRGLQNTIETSLFHSKQNALKNKDSKRLTKVEARISYFKSNYAKKIAPDITIMPMGELQ